jgi:hypothetical protein
MNKIYKAEDLPEGENVYLRKSFDGWRVVYPIKNEDGSMNWFNVFTSGNYWKMIKPFLLLLLLLGFMYVYAHDTSVCRNTVSNIKQICLDYNSINNLINQTNWKLAQDIKLNINVSELQNLVK